MALESARLPEIYQQFPTETVSADDIFLIYKPSTGQTHAILGSDLLGDSADVSTFAWVSTTSYSIDEVVIYNELWWVSLQNANLGNIPSEGAFWTQINKVTTGGLKKWIPGLYVNNDEYVVHNQVIYELNPQPGTPRPYNSQNDPSIDSSNWTVVGFAGGSVTPQNIQNSTFVYDESVGTSTAYDITLAPSITSYQDGQKFMFKAHVENLTNPTMDVNGLGPKSLVRRDGTPLQEGDMPAGSFNEIIYNVDNDNFQLLNAQSANVTRIKIFAFDAANQVGVGIANGQFRLSETDAELPGGIAGEGIVYISNNDLNGIDVSGSFLQAPVGTDITIQQTDDGAKAAIYEIRATPIDQGTYVEIPVTFVSKGGGIPALGIFDDVSICGFVLFEELTSISGSDEAQRISFDTDLDAFFEFVYQTPLQIADIASSAITSLANSYSVKTDDGVTQYSDVGSEEKVNQTTLNANLDARPDGQFVVILTEPILNRKSSIRRVLNLS